MMRLQVDRVEEGLHPNESVVSVKTRHGPVTMLIDNTIVGPDGTVGIGWPVSREDDYYLVELPRETFQGSSRVWVPGEELKNGEEKKRASG